MGVGKSATINTNSGLEFVSVEVPIEEAVVKATIGSTSSRRGYNFFDIISPKK
jgi:hypothetical protein